MIFTKSVDLAEKAMATHSSTLAWRMPWMGDCGGLPSLGSHRVGHNRGDLAAAAADLALSLSHFNTHELLEKHLSPFIAVLISIFIGLSF